ncbi:MAG: glucose 1-dehydrogenase [Chloroflexi bacterium]|nr:glucose 1-dehydrogenase [Chloroflexota bacterium]
MLAVGVVRDKPGVHAFDVPEPRIERPDEVLVRIKEVGIDGTDFNMLRYGIQDIAEGRDVMVMGHEMAGIVEAVGNEVRTVAPGDPVTMTVRRGCGQCQPCLHNQSDMCMTGLYTERGIHRLDGFLTRFAVEQEQYVIKVPPHLVHLAVLTEPLSIVEKGIELIRIIQSRFPWNCPHPEHAFDSQDWGECKTALVVGAGPLGLLATALFRLADVYTFAADIVPEDSNKARLVQSIGAVYLDASVKTQQALMERCCQVGNLDIIFEASGAAATALELINYMARSSIYVMTGIPRGDLRIQIDAAQILRRIVRQNQVVVGSVNSNRRHFEMALRDMDRIAARFSGMPQDMFSHRFRLEDYERAFTTRHPEDIKTVIEVET